MVQALAARHPSIRFWSRPNRGAHSTLNEGISEARGRYLAILNSDDLYHPERLLRCVAALEADPATAVVATRISFLDEHDTPIGNSWYEEVWGFHEQIDDLGLALVNGNFLLTTSNIVARRSVFDEVGRFGDLRYAHDLDFFLRLLARGKRLTLLREPLLAYRIHGGNTVSENPVELQFETAVVAAVFVRSVVAAHGAAAPDPHYLSRLVQLADRNQRSRLLAFAVLYALRMQDGTVSPGSCLADPAFLSALREIQVLEEADAERRWEMETLRATLAARNDEVARLSRKIEELEESRDQLTYMLDSMSWKVTTPLRAIRKLFGPAER